MSVFGSLRWRDGAAVIAALRMPMPGVRRAVSGLPVPVFPETMRPKDRAIELLRAAAEVEHQFIVQYSRWRIS